VRHSPSLETSVIARASVSHPLPRSVATLAAPTGFEPEPLAGSILGHHSIVSSLCSRHMIIHMVMGRREVLVQLDDDLVARLDRLAAEKGTSRSDLLRRGAVAVLDAGELREADEKLRDAYRRVPQDPAIVQAAARLAAQTVPEW